MPPIILTLSAALIKGLGPGDILEVDLLVQRPWRAIWWDRIRFLRWDVPRHEPPAVYEVKAVLASGAKTTTIEVFRWAEL